MSKVKRNEELVSKLHDKYEKLVWYARKSPENLEIDGVKEKVDEVERLYPLDTKELQGEDGDWNHGFNSGIIAAIRYIYDLEEVGEETANEWFPNLDT